MRRHPALAELSRDHHQALAVALRLRRATPETASRARAVFLTFWWEGGAAHFDVEEAVVLPALGRHVLCDRIRAEHAAIRAQAQAVQDDPAPPLGMLTDLGEELATHVRLEERQLFPLLEDALDDAALTRLADDCRRLETRLAPR